VVGEERGWVVEVEDLRRRGGGRREEEREEELW